MTDWKENERKQIIRALNRIADNLGKDCKRNEGEGQMAMAESHNTG